MGGRLTRRGGEPPHLDRGGRGERFLGHLAPVCSSCNSDLKIRSDLPSVAGRVGQLAASERQDHHDTQNQPVPSTEIGKHHYLPMQLVTLKPMQLVTLK